MYSLNLIKQARTTSKFYTKFWSILFVWFSFIPALLKQKKPKMAEMNLRAMVSGRGGGGGGEGGGEAGETPLTSGKVC